MYKAISATILLASDSGEEQDVLFNILAGQGCVVEKLKMEDDLLDQFRNIKPGLVIVAEKGSSVLSSDMSRRLREEADVEEVPFLLVCDAESSLEVLAGSEGVVDFLRRPFGRDDLMARVKVLLTIRQKAVDLSEMRQQLHNAQKLECVGALAAGVAHEFNNMMCSVMGFAELALEGGGMDIAALKESAEISCETAKRATAAARSLLAFSRQATSAKAVGNLNDAVVAAMRLLQRDMEKSGIKIVTELKDLPPTRFAIGSMQQVFLNLIINSWHSMAGTSGVKTLNVRSWAENNQRVYVSVSDTGIGIHPSRHERIFEPFYTTKTGDNSGQIKGSGLGLAIVREVLREHGGTIRVESEEDKGARFIVTLPVETAPVEVTATEKFDPAAFTLPFNRGYSILVVDDEEQNRKAICRLLKKHGHTVFSASNMAEAVPLVWSNKLDLIVLDLVMPGASGDDNVRSLIDQGVDVPILICTGNVDGVAIRKALEAGACGVVTKPFSASEFLSEMHACIAEKSASVGPGKN